MSEKQSSFECTIICWGVAAVVGVVSMVMLYMLAGFDGTQAFFTGAVIGFALGVVLSLFMCRGQTAAADLASDAKPAQRYAREAAEDKARREGAQPHPARQTDLPLLHPQRHQPRLRPLLRLSCQVASSLPNRLRGRPNLHRAKANGSTKVAREKL
ncbi:hypothetical protein [Sulfitobacter sediminilitoris]|uniref:hypothetical protein n=1 Tax=Sulfitobacter sediminilitoris TaxID=2698830 RepID=UPI0036196407